MTHRVHPYSFRLVTLKPWKSRWFNLKKFREYLREDTMIRQWLMEKLMRLHVESIDIERSPNSFHIIIRTTRPALIIGRGGEGVEKLRKEVEHELQNIWKHEVKRGKKPEKRMIKISIHEIQSADLNAAVSAQLIAEELEKRIPFRRVLKQALERISGKREVKGVKIALKGRLDGAEMARYEWLKSGRIPLQTIRADVDYGERRALTTYGIIGVKVWIYKGDIFERPDEMKEVKSER